MYRATRQGHRWVGIVAAAFLLMLSVTGFLLANKSRFPWMRTPAAEGTPIAVAGEIITIEAALLAAFALGHPELLRLEDVDRVDYRPGDNIFKVISRRGYREVQVDGKTGRVLSSSFRNDQLTEDIHDLSFFGDWAHGWLLPLSAVALGGLAASGIGLFLTPIVRRRQFERKRKG